MQERWAVLKDFVLNKRSRALTTLIAHIAATCLLVTLSALDFRTRGVATLQSSSTSFVYYDSLDTGAVPNMSVERADTIGERTAFLVRYRVESIDGGSGPLNSIFLMKRAVVQIIPEQHFITDVGANASDYAAKYVADNCLALLGEQLPLDIITQLESGANTGIASTIKTTAESLIRCVLVVSITYAIIYELCFILTSVVLHRT